MRRRTAALSGLVGTACVYSSAGWMLILGKVQCRAKCRWNKHSRRTRGELLNVLQINFEGGVIFVTENCCHPSPLVVKCVLAGLADASLALACSLYEQTVICLVQQITANGFIK